jgi:integrase
VTARIQPAEGSVITISPLRSLAEIARVRAVITNPRDAALFTVGIRTNLRATDLLALRPGDIDWLTGLLTVREGKTRKIRHIPLSPSTMALLAPLAASEYLFASEKGGKPLTVSSLNHLVKLWTSRAGLTDATYGTRTLRKTWCFIQLTVFNVPLYLISQQLNHSSEAMTQRYCGITPKAVAEVYANDF